MRAVLIVDDNAELASLLAVVAEAHGFTASVALTGADALKAADAAKPDAALVDLLLPDLRGQDLLRQLADRGIACFAMSGVFRGEKLAREALEVHGARAFFEKPLVAREVMRQLLDLLSAGDAVPPPPPEDPSDELDFEEEPRAEAPEAPPGELSLDHDAVETIGAFAVPEAPAPRPPPAPAGAPRAEPEGEPLIPADAPRAAAPPAAQMPFAETAPSRLPPPARKTWQPIVREEGQLPGRSPNCGDLSGTSLARLLTALYQGRQTGELRLRRGPQLKVVGVAEGKPAFALSNLASERFARFAVREGRLQAERLEYLQAEATRAGMRTGEAMVALGLLTEAERAELVGLQVRAIVWSALDWREGTYQLALRAPARADLLPLSLEPGPLILEGVRRTFSLVRLRELVPADAHYFPTADPPYPLHELPLSGGEARLLAHADGSKTVEDLVLLSELEERDALALVHGLAQLGVIEARAPASRRSRVVLV